jgi:hypothetical protein
VFTGRFGRASTEVLFDRICRENGIKHLLTAPRSPTTTGKVERFHKTLKQELLAGKVFDSIVDAQAAIDTWVAHYNTARPHQGIGMVAPVVRFELAIPDPIIPTEPIVTAPPEPGPDVLVVTRKVASNGTVSLETIKYLVGRWLAGQTVQIALRDGLVEITHRGTVVATHARRWRPGKTGTVQRRASPQPTRASTVGVPVVRKVDGSGSVSFAGHAYRVGNAYRRMAATVTIVGDTVQLAVDGQLVRTHPIRHDRSKEHGAFANPAGKPDRINAAPPPRTLADAV